MYTPDLLFNSLTNNKSKAVDDFNITGRHLICIQQFTLVSFNASVTKDILISFWKGVFMHCIAFLLYNHIAHMKLESLGFTFTFVNLDPLYLSCAESLFSFFTFITFLPFFG